MLCYISIIFHAPFKPSFFFSYRQHDDTIIPLHDEKNAMYWVGWFCVYAVFICYQSYKSDLASQQISNWISFTRILMGWNRIRSETSTDKRQTTHRFQHFECVYWFFCRRCFAHSILFFRLQCVSIFFSTSYRCGYLLLLHDFLSLLCCFAMAFALIVYFCVDVASAIFSTRFVSFNFNFIYLLRFVFFVHVLHVALLNVRLVSLVDLPIAWSSFMGIAIVCLFICNKSHSSILCVFVFRISF